MWKVFFLWLAEWGQAYIAFLQTKAKSLSSVLELVRCYSALILELYNPVTEALDENWKEKPHMLKVYETMALNIATKAVAGAL